MATAPVDRSLPKRGRPARLPTEAMAEAASITHADLRQARRHLAAAFRLLQVSEQRLVPVVRTLDDCAGREATS